MTKKSIILLLLTTLNAPVGALNVAEQQLNGEATKREAFFRGAWIATVANIDWPSTATIGDPEAQQAELISELDQLAALGLNAIVFQVRPTADALYESTLEPISHWLTGRQGSWESLMLWDPLDFVCAAAHERNMDVHVWINPYRVTISQMDTTMLAPDHIMRQHPEWFWQYGQQWYFEPGLDETRSWISGIVSDIVSRYNIDAVHMDDYFYPYPLKGKPLPDEACFQAHPRCYTDIRDWRRNNVNLAIRDISATIRAIKPHVEFGISPFGVWKNGGEDGSATRAGITNYDDLYADILLWMREGWIDYVLPQLYWEIGKSVADYEVLAHWWADRTREINAQHSTLNTQHSVNLYIGMAPYRLGGKNEAAAWKTGNEIARQMRLNRTIPEISGECFYSTRPLLRNPLHVCDSIKTIYKNEIVK